MNELTANYNRWFEIVKVCDSNETFSSYCFVDLVYQYTPDGYLTFGHACEILYKLMWFISAIG